MTTRLPEPNRMLKRIWYLEQSLDLGKSEERGYLSTNLRFASVSELRAVILRPEKLRLGQEAHQ